MEIINDMDPEILETQPRLAFRLQQQAVIEMIRKGDMEGALNHAQVCTRHSR